MRGAAGWRPWIIFWPIATRWKPEPRLDAGQETPGPQPLATLDGRWLPLEATLDTGRVETVYNLRVADFHTYFVGSREWGFAAWVHNAYQPPTGLLSDKYGVAGREALANAVSETSSLSEAKELVRPTVSLPG